MIMGIITSTWGTYVAIKSLLSLIKRDISEKSCCKQCKNKKDLRKLFHEDTNRPQARLKEDSVVLF